MQNALAVLELASIDYWLSSADFADAGRNAQLIAFVWWQGAADGEMPLSEYVSKLRAVIARARAANAVLPVRIVELPELPDRVVPRAAQRVVAGDPGVQLIRTADLIPADAAGHFTDLSYRVVRDRIYASLGR